MNFNAVEQSDHFQDETIFWVSLSDPPAALKSRAMLIDGDNYNEACFGVCVAFDAGTQQFSLVPEVNQGKICNIYYIDNDGDKHWFACEITRKLEKRIFSECKQILDFKKIEYGCEIKKDIQFENGSGFVLAKNPVPDRPFLTAHFTAAARGQRNYDERKSFHSWNEAVEDFIKCTERQKQFMCVKLGQPQTDTPRRNSTNQVRSKANRPKRKRR